MKALRIRIFTHASEGPHWLTLLAVCGWLRGGIISADLGFDGDAEPLEVVTVTPIKTISVENEHGQVVHMSREEWEGRQNGTWKTYPAHGF